MLIFREFQYYNFGITMEKKIRSTISSEHYSWNFGGIVFFTSRLRTGRIITLQFMISGWNNVKCYVKSFPTVWVTSSEFLRYLRYLKKSTKCEELIKTNCFPLISLQLCLTKAEMSKFKTIGFNHFYRSNRKNKLRKFIK